MPDIAAIRAGIAANLAAVFKPTTAQVSAYLLANPTLPCIYVIPAGTEFDIAMGNGSDRLTFIVRALVPATADQAQQQVLDLMCASTGSLSIKAAIEADDTLGGTVADSQVNSVSAPQMYVPDNGPPALGVDFELEVIT